MNIPLRMKCNAATGIKTAPQVFSDHLGIPTLAFPSFKGYHLKTWQSNIKRMSKTICMTIKMLLADVSGHRGSIPFWDRLQEQCLGLEGKLWNQTLGGHGGSCGREHSLPASPTCRPLRVGKGAAGKHCTHLLLQHLLSTPAVLGVLPVRPGLATLLPTFGHPSSPWQERMGGERGLGRLCSLIGGVRLLSGGSQVLLPSQQVRILLGTDGRGGCPITKLSLQNTMWLLAFWKEPFWIPSPSVYTSTHWPDQEQLLSVMGRVPLK